MVRFDNKFLCIMFLSHAWRSSWRATAFQSLSKRQRLTRRFLSSNSDFFAPTDFAALGIESPVLLKRLESLGFTNPTAVQAAAFSQIAANQGDITIGAETGSGKTLAYLLPLVNDILQRKATANQESSSALITSYDYARALILVPNKELVQQVVRMAVALAGGPQALVFGGSTLPPASLDYDGNAELQPDESELVRIAIVPGGIKEPEDFQPFRNAVGLGGNDPPVDLLVSTPAAIGPLGLSPKNIELFADIETVVIDEADMLLDGGYLRPLENVMMGFKRAGKLQNAEWGGDAKTSKTQHVFVAATLPDFGLRSVDAYLQKRFPYATRISMANMHQARHSGLVEQTQWIPLTSKKERMQELVRLLQTDPSEGGLKGEKVMVFLNSVEDVEGASQALERVGLSALPYHAKKGLEERTNTLRRFRNYSTEKAEEDDDSLPILICTDLASRGLDVPGVTAVIQLQFAGNVVAHLHRMGRCGRAGQQVGRGIVFYDDETEGALVEVVQQAEAQQERMVLPGDVDFKDEDEEDAGSVKKAFSRKRGFTKKRKKLQRESRND